MSTITQLSVVLIPLWAACAQPVVGEQEDFDGYSKTADSAAFDVVDAKPMSCQDILDEDPTATDGSYTLYVDGDATMPWTVWCHDMSGTPTEYLSLTQTDYRKNASMWPCDGIPMGWEYGAKVYTAFSRVRIDPDTLTVDPYDYTFSTSSGECHSYQVLTALGWGFAGACGGNPTGRADVDLTGTPFAIASNAFYIEGWMAHGSATYSDDGQVVKVRGGGACGYMLPTDADSTIQLVYNL